MKKKSLLYLLITIFALFALGPKIYKYFFSKKRNLPFQTTTLKQKDIQQTIYASGNLQIKDNIKIGSLIAGTIIDIYVAEGDKVKKGQLLTLIDNGKGDTDVQIAQGTLKKATSQLTYITNHFERQKKLYQTKQLSKDAFEEITNDYNAAKAEVQIAKAELEKKKIEFNNTKVIAPEDGIITKIGITKGMKITTDLDATVLFEMAKDLTKMEAKLDIDESDIGKINKDQIIKFTVDAYQNRKFKGKISTISYSSKQKSNLQTYEAVANVKNKNLSLRPGMTVNAKITINKIKECDILNNQAFQISSQPLKIAAKTLNLKFEPLEKAEKKKLKKVKLEKNQMKFIWCKNKESIIEKAIEVGITDDNSYQVVKGLKPHDQIIIDVDESDDMEKIYKNWFSKGL